MPREGWVPLSSGAPRDKHPRDAAARGSKGLPPPTADSEIRRMLISV